MIFAPSRLRFGASVLLAVLLTACGQDSGPSANQAGSSSPAAGFTADRPPTQGGLEVLVQPDEDPGRPGYFDFGKVQLGEMVTHTFVLKNTDPRKVILQKVDPGCGCTVPLIGKRLPDGSLEAALSDRPGELMHLEPGEVVEVLLRVDTTAIRTKNIDKHFMVRLASDSVVRPFITLECHLFVRQRFQVAPASIDLDAIPIGAGKEGKVTIKAMGPELSRITGLGPLPEGVVARVEESPLGGPDGGVWVLQAGFLPPLERGRIATQITLHTETLTGEPGMDLTVSLAGTGVDDVTVSPSRLILRPAHQPPGGAAPEANPARIEAQLVSHLAGHRFMVTGYTITGDAADALHLEAEAYLPALDGTSGQWNLALVAVEKPPLAAFTGTITIELDDPQYPTIEIPYAGLGF